MKYDKTEEYLGTKYGMNLTIGFTDYDVLKVKWFTVKGSNDVDLFISDLFDGEDEKVIYQLVNMVLDRAFGENKGVPTDALDEYLASDGFLVKYRAFLKRNDSQYEEPVDAVKKFFDNLYKGENLTLTVGDCKGGVSWASTLSRTVRITPELNNPDVPVNVLEYAFLAPVKCILYRNGWKQDDYVGRAKMDARDEIESTPRYQTAKNWLEEHNIPTRI